MLGGKIGGRSGHDCSLSTAKQACADCTLAQTAGRAVQDRGGVAAHLKRQAPLPALLECRDEGCVPAAGKWQSAAAAQLPGEAWEAWHGTKNAACWAAGQEIAEWTHVTTSGLQPWVSICSNTSLAFCHWAPAGPEREKAEQLEAKEEVGAVGCKQAQPTVHSLMHQKSRASPTKTSVRAHPVPER